MSQGVENRGSLISVPLALRDLCPVPHLGVSELLSQIPDDFTENSSKNQSLKGSAGKAFLNPPKNYYPFNSYFVLYFPLSLYFARSPENFCGFFLRTRLGILQ